MAKQIKKSIYAFDVNRPDFDHKEVLGKMINYSSMTWGEVKRQTHDDGKSKHHFLAPGSLSSGFVTGKDFMFCGMIQITKYAHQKRGTHS